MKGPICVGALLVCLASAAEAKTKPVMTLEMAKKVAVRAEAEAKKRNAPGGAIAIVDDGGHALVLVRLDGTFPAAASVALDKARTAATFKKPTKAFEEAVKNGRVALTAVTQMLPLEGGVPIVVAGEVVGAIGVSGAASADQDEEIASAASTALNGASAEAEMMPTSFFAQREVLEAFRRGAVLHNVGAYQVHTSRRAGPGQAEVHALDTDILYVLSGTATLVTGGNVVEGKEVEPHEVRGAKIVKGQTRKISPGDIVVIPHGTPHWFAQVPGPIEYMAVKVRDGERSL